MVSKYAAIGMIFEVGREVDAATSLIYLEGRLDEAKRKAALAALAASPVLRKAEPPDVDQPVVKSAKSQKDEVELEIKRLQYAREAAQLVSAEEVDYAAAVAVAILREVFGRRYREIAARICTEFDLAPEKATALAAHLARELESILGSFAVDMTKLAHPGGVTPPASIISARAST